MCTFSTIRTATVLALAALVPGMTGCHQAPAADTAQVRQAAVDTIAFDGSSSTAFIASPAYGDAAIRRVSDLVKRQQLGDGVRIMAFGSRTSDNAVNVLSANSGYALRIPAMRKDVEARLAQMMAQARQRGGDSSTNILYALENAHVACTPRSRLVILSDGIEASESYSAASALSAGQPVQLPPPASPYLKGCAVEFIGIGVAPMGDGMDAETLPNAQLQALISGWRTYFEAAGVQPGDMTFTSIL